MKTNSEKPLGQRMMSRMSRPTDYTQRSVKLRIFGLLAALMVVLAIGERVRDPKFWKWLSDLDSRPVAEGPPSSRLTPKPLRTAGDPEGTFVSAPSNGDSAAAPLDTSPAPDDIDPVERAWDQGWKDVFQRLDADQRTLLFELLHTAGKHQALAGTRTEAAASLLEAMTTLWEDYQAVAFQSVVTLPAADQSLWVDVLRQVNRRWNEDLRPSLQAIIDGRTPTEHEERMLAGYQQTLDALALARIEDDTVFLRPAEREIWLRLEGRVQDTPAEQLARESVGTVGYLQLHKQSDEYRGKVVTIRGTVKHAYRVPALDNYLGVKEHVVYWIMPEGGPPSPIVVYALAAPEGFPKIQDGSGGDKLRKLHEEVVITGFFLKRGAYLGKDDTYPAPLLIAGTPKWIPRTTSLQDASRYSIGPPWLLPSVGVALLLSAVAFAFIYFRVRRGEAEARAIIAEGLAHNPPPLAGLEVRPSASETLKQMEAEAHRSA
ncbi:MAG: hypothetical protein SFU86_13030 [Pirellulaceae bacterium]|nr:hypothetical protein [Pirellulaceae bacterium]